MVFSSVASLPLLLLHTSHAFVSTRRPLSSTHLHAKPKRLKENAEGVVFVNDKCINCAACSGFAPDTFERRGGYHVVHQQPQTKDEIEEARAALVACPVAAIRLDSLADRRHGATDKKAAEDSWTEQDENLKEKLSSRNAEKPFPRPLYDIPDTYFTGYHNAASFGAIPYLVQARVDGRKQWIMVDSPKFTKVSRAAVTSVTGEKGPDYLLLTHVDDTADHGKWAKEFEGLKEVFHSGDLGKHNWVGDQTLEDVDILLDSEANLENGLLVYSINGELLESADSTDDEVVILYTPGHSPGSITLFHKTKQVIFTGDTYARSALGKMTGFPRYGNNLRLQSDILNRMLEIDWRVVAPGHGHARDYRGEPSNLRNEEMKVALEELAFYH